MSTNALPRSYLLFAVPLVGAALLCSGMKAHAIPVDCLGFDSICTVSDQEAQIVVAGYNTGALFDLVINGIDHMHDNSYHMFVGPGPHSGTPMFISQVLGEPISATKDEEINRIVVNFSSPNVGLNASITYALIGGSTSARVAETFTMTNTSTGPIDIRLFEYTDWDLNQSNIADTAFFDGANTLVQFEDDVLATVTSFTPFDFFNVDRCCFTFVLNTGADGNLENNSGPVGPGDVAYAFQYNFTLEAEGGTFTVLKSKNVITEPATLLLMGIGLVGVGFARRRRNSG